MMNLVEKNGDRQWIPAEHQQEHEEAGWVLLGSWDGEPPLYYTLEGGIIERDFGPTRDERWFRTKEIRSEKLLFAPTTFGDAQCDIDSMVKINGLVTMALLAKNANIPYSEIFTMYDNSEVEMDADEMISFGMQVGIHVAAVHARGRELRAMLFDQNNDPFDVDVESGWPGT